MRLAVFDTHVYDREALTAANVRYGHDLAFFEPRLTSQTASMTMGVPAVCSFVNDRVDADALAPGVSHARSAGEHRRHDPGERSCLRTW